jgi:hypothetical protein
MNSSQDGCQARNDEGLPRNIGDLHRKDGCQFKKCKIPQNRRYHEEVPHIMTKLVIIALHDRAPDDIHGDHEGTT